MVTVFNVIQILISAVLVVVILLQVRGGGAGDIFGGGAATTFRTRRGLERRLFQFTIVLAAAFIVVSILSVALT